MHLADKERRLSEVSVTEDERRKNSRKIKRCQVNIRHMKPFSAAANIDWHRMCMLRFVHSMCALSSSREVVAASASIGAAAALWPYSMRYICYKQKMPLHSPHSHTHTHPDRRRRQKDRGDRQTHTKQ